MSTDEVPSDGQTNARADSSAIDLTANDDDTANADQNSNKPTKIVKEQLAR